MIVADPGEVLVHADYAGIEMRSVAALAQEPSMMTAFSNGEDIHQSVADRLGIDRKVAKAVNFATIYGGGAATISRQAGIDKVEAAERESLYTRRRIGTDRRQHQADDGRNERLQDFSGADER